MDATKLQPKPSGTGKEVTSLALFVEHRRQEDLDAVLCNAAMLAWFKEKGFLGER